MKKILLFIFSIIIIGEVHAQDPQFSQFYANPIYLNPAFAGSHGCPRFAVNYRNQWPALSGTFVTYSASYDQYFKSIAGGVGVIATHDQQGKGTINTTTLSLIYNYHLKVNRKFTMMFAGKATWNQKFLDWDKLTFGDMMTHEEDLFMRLEMCHEEDQKDFLMLQPEWLDLPISFSLEFLLII